MYQLKAVTFFPVWKLLWAVSFWNYILLGKAAIPSIVFLPSSYGKSLIKVCTDPEVTVTLFLSLIQGAIRMF